MTNTDTATLQECCLALSDFVRPGWRDGYVSGEHPFTDEQLLLVCPVKPCLDSIAGALPEGWMWVSVRWHPAVALAPEHSWGCNVINLRRTGGCETYGPDEATARARAAVKCWMTVKGEACSQA